MKFGKTVVRSAVAGVVCCCALLGLNGCKRHKRTATSPPNTTDYAGNVQRLDQVSTLTGMRWPNYADDLGNVQKFYNDRDNELAWTRRERGGGLRG